MFYTGDPIATKNVENIIKNLPAASKAAYTKQMATVRSQFHRDAASSRRAEVDKLLHDTLPSSIIIKAVGNDSSLWAMRSPRARQERLDRLKKFINAHCVRNMVGVHPFLTPSLFCEAGGEPFLVDSIQFLKGVLGFEDHLKPLVASSLRTSIGGTSTNTYDAEESEDEDEGGVRSRRDGTISHQPSERVVEEGPFADSSISVSVEDSYGQARGLKAISQEHSSPRITVSPPATEEVHHQPSPLGIGYNPNPRQPVHRTSSISTRPTDLKPTNENL
ncbi:hypothetical protein KEM48_004620, partial [Puccinia striiformis f. sp. tritici PST-130]